MGVLFQIKFCLNSTHIPLEWLRSFQRFLVDRGSLPIPRRKLYSRLIDFYPDKIYEKQQMRKLEIIEFGSDSP